MSLEEQPERHILTLRLVLKVFAVSLLLFLINVILRVTSLADVETWSVVAGVAILFSAFSFAFGVLIAVLYFMLR